MNVFQSLDELTSIGELVYFENIEALEKEISNGLDINSSIDVTKDITDTLICFAIYENKKNVVNWLLSKGAQFDYDDKDSSLFLMACSSFDFDIVQLLLKKGANVNAKEKRTRKTAMMNALYGENFSIIKLLIENGYNLKNDGISLRQAVFGK